MKEEDLVKKWEQSGLLDTVSIGMKNLYSMNLEKACRFLKIRNGNDQVETLIFPIVFRITKLDKSVDVIQTVENFIKFYKKTKLNVYNNYIDDYKNDENDENDLEIIEKFIINYIKNKLN
jgi:uncharacterized protein (UPF0305 family)